MMITSFSNPLIKRIKRLRRKKYRRQEGVYFVEGVRIVLAAVEHQAAIETIVFSSELLTSEKAWQMIAEQRHAGTPCVDLSREVYQSISTRENAVGLGAIVSFSGTAIGDLKVDQKSLFVALVEVSEPGNLGTILRIIDAVGASGLILVGPSVDPYHPTAVKASMGSVFSIPLCQLKDIDSLISWSESQAIHVVATSAHADRSYRQNGYHFPALLLLGSEGEGLSDEVIRKTELAVSIPMRGSSSSLNLAVATGIILYEVAHSRDQ
jgi:TrmH family RNA methyltransferase